MKSIKLLLPIELSGPWFVHASTTNYPELFHLHPYSSFFFISTIAPVYRQTYLSKSCKNNQMYDDHYNPCKCSNLLSYQSMRFTCIYSKVSIATLFSLLLIVFLYFNNCPRVSPNIFIEILQKQSDVWWSLQSLQML